MVVETLSFTIHGRQATIVKYCEFYVIVPGTGEEAEQSYHEGMWLSTDGEWKTNYGYRGHDVQRARDYAAQFSDRPQLSYEELCAQEAAEW